MLKVLNLLSCFVSTSEAKLGNAKDRPLNVDSHTVSTSEFLVVVSQLPGEWMTTLSNIDTTLNTAFINAHTTNHTKVT